jgi:cell volume regulation protein A
MDYYLVAFAALLFAGVLTSIVFDRFGVPALLLFLAIGMLAGSDGPGGFHFDDASLAQLVGVLALIYILFAGGLTTEWAATRPVLKEGVLLATGGVLVTATIVGAFVKYLLDFSWVEGLLLGAIISSTDAAAVFSVLRAKSLHLKGHLKPLLEFESGSNDPMAVFLTVGFIGLLTAPEARPAGMLFAFVLQMLLGAVGGYLMGQVMIFFVRRLRLGHDGLYPVLTLSLVLLTYGVLDLVGGNGFLAVYVAGIVIGNRKFVHKQMLLSFHDGLAWLMQIAMFVTLGLLVFPSRVVPVMGLGVLIAACLIFVARPFSVFLLTAFSGWSLREKAFVSWVGLRGAVPIILATYPLLAGVERAQFMFNVVFFVVITSVVLQGTTLPLVAKWLRVDADMP